MLKSFKKIAVFLIIFSFAFVIGNTVLAQIDTGINQASGIGLGDTDPRIIAANVIRVFLGFLGVIALVLILYAGFLWTMSSGDPSKIDKAKKILISAVIGLLIILSAFAIASFILSRLLGTTTGGAGGGGGGGGGPLPPGPGPSGLSCDGNTLTPVCDPDNSFCVTATEYCEPASCTCQLLGGFGDPCDLDTLTPVCDPDDTMCMSALSCDGTTCLCGGAPIIDWISPVDELGTPNGAIGDFVTLGGRFFGTTTGQVYFSDATGNPTILAQFPNSVNTNCTDSWNDWQIIVVVPAGAQDGPVRIVRQIDLEEDVTNNTRGPAIDDFLINATNRPGLCLVNPAFGYYEDTFNLQGVSFTGTIQEVSFGSMIGSTSATNIINWTNTSVDADVPNIRGGNNTVFVTADGAYSNALSFNVYIDLNNTPIIDHINPNPAPPGQYSTIFGNNFGNSYLAPAQVLFTHQVTGSTYVADGLDFPIECQDSWWRNNYIIMKVPPQIRTDGNFGLYDVVVTNNAGFSSLPETFDAINAPPGPGICEMIPHNGPIGFDVEIIGDNFTTTIGAVDFYDTINAPSILTWTNQSIETVVPAGSQTGPVRATTLAPSNPFPFMVGNCDPSIAPTDPLFQCTTGIEECCAADTYWDGICRNTGTCNDGAAITTTGYGWTFTSEGVIGTATTTGLTCSGWSSGNACLVDGNNCPNSPGECQTDPAPLTGFCSDSYCESLAGCGLGNCEYDNTLNRCVATFGGAYQDTCSQTTSMTFDATPYDATCALVTAASGQVGAWQIQTGGASCPTGTYQDTNGWCTVGSPTLGPLTCDLCDTGYSCSLGQCAIGGSVCNSASACNVSGFCEGPATCECCCEVAANDCCLGLTCEAGGCGDMADATVQADYGLCTGCRVEDGADNTTVSASEQAASDLACNCTGTAGKFCYIDSTAPTGDPLLSGVCLDVLTPPGGGIGADCDDPLLPGICDPDQSMCLPGLFCGTSCTCQPENTLPGAQCIQDLTIGLTSVFTCNPSFACGTGYSCLDDPLISDPIEDCGTCCCDPTIPQTIISPEGDTLTCQPDKSPCGGATRGLYCGCDTDLECGNPNTAACGDDTCCRPRPQVVSTSPPDEPAPGSTDVCRNVLLEAYFDTEMDTSSFRGNIILLGDYGNDSCPDGTNYLTIENGDENYINKNVFAKVFNNIKEKITSLIFGEASAYNFVTPTNNFCAIQGKSDGYNNTAGQGVLTFAPNRALDGDIRHYAIILGDEDTLDDIPRGVLDRFSVSMGVNSTYPLETFNSTDYVNSYIWSFVTLSDQGENQGLCTIDYIDVDPASYLFQTTENSLVEEDTDILNVSGTFDTERDADKLFVATARTMSGQSLNPVAGLYTWAWGWVINNYGLADFAGVFPANSNKKLIRADSTATEGSTEAEATTAVTGSLALPAETHTGSANIYLFLCNNPWPPIDGAGLWAPWQDQDNNCDILPEGAGTCANTNYEFYYCRDQGSESTFDDLPPILDDAIIRGRDTDQDLFKEYYFFREATPDLSTIALDVSSVPAAGESIDIWWGNFVPDAGEVLDEFLIHYGTSSGNYTSTMSVGPFVPHTLVSPVIVPDLINGQTYYFAITAVYESGAESDLSNEITAVPEDTQDPVAPLVINAAIGNAEAEIEWNPVVDAVSYNLYWKAGTGCAASTPPDCYGSSQNVGDATAASITDLTNGTIYFFAVTAVDASGNESAYSNEVSVIPAVTSATVISGATQVALGWISASLANQDDIYYIDMGSIAGIFEEFEEEGNRINLFGDIIKYFIKKISYSFINSAEAQGGELRIPLCSTSPGSICREQVIEADGKHSTVIKNLSSGRKYRFIIKNGPTDNQEVVDDIVVEMMEPDATQATTPAGVSPDCVNGECADPDYLEITQVKYLEETNEIQLTWDSQSDVEYYVFGYEGALNNDPPIATIMSQGEGETSWKEVVDTSHKYYIVYSNNSESDPVGYQEINANEGITQFDFPFNSFDKSVGGIFGTQVIGGTNEADSDRIWKNNGVNYEFSWLVDGVASEYDGMWFNGNLPTEVEIYHNDETIIQIREGHPVQDVVITGACPNPADCQNELVIETY
ncbi:MAG: hypothetical protein PF572_02465 [Patescibacteria group bacterium]|jgi:hypothetical protein|nr:hypothetical protein [Patescibacteria group bacterium]